MSSDYQVPALWFPLNIEQTIDLVGATGHVQKAWSCLLEVPLEVVCVWCMFMESAYGLYILCQHKCLVAYLRSNMDVTMPDCII